MTKKRIKLVLSIAAVAVLFILAARIVKRPAPTTSEKPILPQNVTVQPASDSKSFSKTIVYPGTIVGDQEVRVTSKSAGTAQAVNFSLGSKVGAGSLLVRVDDTGSNLGIGDNGFRSSQVQESQLAVDQAKEQSELAKKSYHALSDAYDSQKKNPTAAQTVTKAQVVVAKEQVDIAKIQLENAKVNLKGTLDNHLVTSPIAGYVTEKSVALGDSISDGQLLATISKTSNMKIQFFVDQGQLATLKAGQEISVSDSQGNNYKALIKNISPSADSATKRFLIEAFPTQQNPQILISGTIVTVTFQVVKNVEQASDLILPLSAVNIGQNQNYIFLAVDGKAKLVNVSLQNVDGETAEISGDIPADAEIILNGSKLVQDGSSINIQ